MESILIKQNINFLEYPLWKLSEDPTKELKIENDRGSYLLRSGYKIPERVDMLFLFYLLMVSQKNSYTKNLELSRHEILKACGMGKSEKDYKRLEESLERWKHLGLKFKGTFYDDKDYLVRSFGIINEYEIDEETKKLKIELNRSFVLMIKNSKFCKYIDFENYKKLKRPMSNRLYEILSKAFKKSNEWQIEALKLAQKLTLKTDGNRKLYPSDIKIKVTPAVNEINKNTELRINFKSYKNDNGETIFTFKLLENLSELKQQDDDKKIQTLIDLLREGYKQNERLKNTVQQYYSKFGFDYVKYNILYTNQKASKAYIGFLKKALKENWGKEIKEDEENKKQKEKQIQLKQLEETQESIINSEKEKDDKRKAQEIIDWIESLNKTQKKNFFAKTIDRIDDERKNIAKINLNVNKKLMIPTIMMFSKELSEQKRTLIKIKV